MAGFQQYTFQHGRRAGNVDLSEANAWESISNSLINFGASLSRDADIKQEKAVKAYVNSQEDDIITKIGQLSIDNENDYDAFISQAEGYKKGKIDVMSKEPGLGPEFTSGFSQMLDDKIAQYGESVYRKHAAKEKASTIFSERESLNTHVADTEHMMQQAIDFYYENPSRQATFAEDFGPKFKVQTDMFADKIDGLIGLGLSGKEAFTEEQNIRTSLYKKAAMAEMLRANQGGSDKAWGVIQEFNNNPSKFFSSRPHLQAMFQDGKVVISDEEKNLAFEDMLSTLSGYQSQQDRILSGKAESLQVEYNKQHAYLVNLIATQPGLVTLDMVKNSYNEGSLGTKEHDSLVKIIQRGSVFRDDDNIVSQINTAMFDPEADQFEIYDMITTAQENGQLSVSTQKQLLKDLRSESFKDITGDSDYQLAIAEIKTEFRTTGMLQAFAPNESKNINQAIREVYKLRRTLKPDQDFFVEVDKIKSKFKKAVKPAATLNWRSYWVGSKEEPDQAETELRLNKLLDSKQITTPQYHEDMKNLKNFMDNYNARKSR